MSLEQQKNNFLKTTKGIKAVTFARKWFDDFSEFKLSPAYLQNFYVTEKYSSSNAIPISAEKDFNDYELLFWFWFYKRNSRLETEYQIFVNNENYKRELAEIEKNNPLNILGDLSALIKFIPIGIVLFAGVKLLGNNR